MDQSHLKYTKTHEWARRRGELVEVGITDFAQRQLTDVTYVELPEVGRQLTANAPAAVLESIKAAADVYAPLAGTVTEVNAALASTPEMVNADPYGAGWLFRLTPTNPADLEQLLDAVKYEALLTPQP